MFTKNQDEPFSVEIDEYSGARYLRGRGSFDGPNTIKSNYLSSSDPFSILELIFMSIKDLRKMIVKYIFLMIL